MTHRQHVRRRKAIRIAQQLHELAIQAGGRVDQVCGPGIGDPRLQP